MELTRRKHSIKIFRNYIRFKTPSISLSNILSNDDGPFAELVDSISAMTPVDHDSASKKIELRINLFTCITKSALRDTVQIIRNTSDEKDCNHLAREYINNTEKITTVYRELGTQLLQPGIPDAALVIHKFADE